MFFPFKRCVPAVLAAAIGWLSAAPAAAEVFSLWPFGRGDGPAPTENRLPELENLKAAISEPVVINGIETRLDTCQADFSIDELLSRLKALPRSAWLMNADTILLNVKLANGWVKRYVVVYSGPDCKPVVFTIAVPAQLPEKFAWPQTLPLPSGCTPLRCIYFPHREAWYGCFSVTGMPERAFTETAARLAAENWRSVSGEADAGSGHGEIFLRTGADSAVMMVNIGKNSGSVYTRKIRP